jgi:Ca2+-binding EF-hand superfamily protein
MNDQYDLDNYRTDKTTDTTGVWHELALSQTWNSMDALQHMKNAFKKIDRDENGYLSQTELLNMSTSTAEDPQLRVAASAINRMRASLSSQSNDEWGSESEVSEADLDEMTAVATEPDSTVHREIKETLDEARFEQASSAIKSDIPYIDKNSDGNVTRAELESNELPDEAKGTASFLKFNYSRLTAMTGEMSIDSKLDGDLTMINKHADEYRNAEILRDARAWGALSAAYAAYTGCELGVAPAYAVGAAGGMAGGLLYKKIMRNYISNLRLSFSSLSYPDDTEK